MAVLAVVLVEMVAVHHLTQQIQAVQLVALVFILQALISTHQGKDMTAVDQTFLVKKALVAVVEAQEVLAHKVLLDRAL
jgi:hypothetical protein